MQKNPLHNGVAHRIPIRFALFALAGIGAVVVLISLLALDLEQGYVREVSDAQARTGSIANILASDLEDSVDKIDIVTKEAQYHYEALLDGKGVSAREMVPMLHRLLERIPGVLSLRVVDETGRYVFDASGKSSNANVSDRRYFQVHAQGVATDERTGWKAGNLYGEGPLFSRVANLWTFTFSRGVHDSQGRFRGIIQSSISIDWLAQAMGRVEPEQTDSVALFNLDQILIARIPSTPDQIGKFVNASTLREKLLESPISGHFSAKSAADGLARVYSYRRVVGMPVVVAVGISRDRVLSAWKQTVVVYALIALVAIALNVVLLVRSYRLLQTSYRKDEARYREILRTATDGIHILDEQGNLLEASESFYRLLGRDADDGVVLNVRDWDVHTPPEDIARFLKTIDRRARLFTTRYRRVDGSTCDVEVNSHAIRLGDRRLVYCTARDVTEKLRRDAERSRLLMILDQSPDIIAMSDIDLYLVYLNPAGARLLGRREGAGLAGLRLTDLHTEDAARQLVAEILPKALDQGGWSWESEVSDREGHRTAVSQLLLVHRNGSGHAEFFSTIMRDMSARRSIELELRQAKDKAETADLAKSRFLATMSHEIRTPLNAILGMLTLMHHTGLSDKQEAYVDKTEGAAKSLLSLLNAILDYSKLEADKMTLEAAEFDLDDVMRELAVVLTPGVDDRDVEILFDLDPAVPRKLEGDALRIKQVLINLGTNAVKFTSAGTVTVAVTLLHSQGGQAQVRFSVTDSGIGIAPENQRHIFEGFTQAEASITRRFGGTGLGLAISSRIVALMGGELQLESEPGRGSRFFFDIVLATPATSVPGPDAALGPDARRRVLVIEPNAAARAAMESMLRTLGWEGEFVALAAQARDCVARLSQPGARPLDAVFVATRLDDEDGWTLAAWLHGQPGAGVVVMMGRSGMELLTHKGDRRVPGFDEFLAKPFTATMLSVAADEARLARSAAGRAPRRAGTQRVQRLDGMKILLVEDNPINQQVARELLQAEGAQVTVVGNGALGVQALERSRSGWDAVVMDIQMPVMDGYTATRMIRNDLGLLDLPVIAMTANTLASDQEESLRAGMNAHVGKPFKLETLVEVLLRVTRFQGPQDVAASDAGDGSPATSDRARPEYASVVATLGHRLQLAEALQRMRGDSALLLSVLRSFAVDLPQQMDALDRAFAGRQRAETLSTLHLLKGLTATVGAQRLSSLAADAESTLREWIPQSAQEPFPSDMQYLVQQLRAEASTLHAELASALSAAQAAGHQVTPGFGGGGHERAVLDNEIRDLMALLRKSDLASMDVYAGIRDVFGADGDAGLQTLDQAMAHLDFAAALAACEALVARRVDEVKLHNDPDT